MRKVAVTFTNGSRCDRVFVAVTPWERTRGLLGRPELLQREGLWIKRCSSVHTFGMGCPIDVVFLNKELKILKAFECLKPFRLAGAWGAMDVLELRQGTIAAFGLQAGMSATVSP